MKRTLAILLCLILLLALCACGGQDSGTKNSEQPEATAKPLETPEPTPEPPPEIPAIVGTYKMTGATGEVEEGTDGEEMLALMDAFGITIYLVVEENGGAYLDVSEQKTQLGWDDDTFWFDDDKDARLDYELSGGVLTLRNADGSMSFTPLTDEELEYYRENGSAVTGLDIEDDTMPEGEPSTGPVSGTVSGCPVTILGAEALVDDDGEPALRIYYEFTNAQAECSSASSTLSVEAYQDGEELDYGYIYEDRIPEDDYSSLSIVPGLTIRCTETFLYQPEGGTVGIRLRNYFGDAVLYYVDPQAPLGAPEDSFRIEKMDRLPAILSGLPAASDELSILDFELTASYDDTPLIRFYYDFTNLSEEETSCFMSHTMRAYQDGVELESGYAWYDDVETDSYFYEDVAAGETLHCSVCFELRTDSPVVLVIEHDDTGAQVGLIAEELPYPISGYYRLSVISDISVEDYAAMAEIEVEEARDLITLNLAFDGTGTWSNQDEDYEIEWELDGEELFINSESTDEHFSGYLEDGKLIFELGDYVFELAKEN